MIMVQRNAAGSLRVSLNYLSPRELGDKGGESEYEDSAGGFASLNPPYPLPAAIFHLADLRLPCLSEGC